MPAITRGKKAGTQGNAGEPRLDKIGESNQEGMGETAGIKTKNQCAAFPAQPRANDTVAAIILPPGIEVVLEPCPEIFNRIIWAANSDLDFNIRRGLGEG